MTLFDKYEPEEFLLFVSNFQMTLEAPGTLAVAVNIQYLCILLCGKALCQLGTLSIEVESTTKEHLKLILLRLGT